VGTENVLPYTSPKRKRWGKQTPALALRAGTKRTRWGKQNPVPTLRAATNRGWSCVRETVKKKLGIGYGLHH
jgi:hypothetical protein